MKDVVVAQLANKRAGTASTKTKGEVAGSGKKPWRQKGTGQARAGYRQSPVWRGGGVVFGPKPRDYSKKITKGVARLALQRAFSDKVAGGNVIIVDDFVIDAPKTKSFVTALKAIDAGSRVLVVVDQVSADLKRASRNVPTATVVRSSDVNVYQLLRGGKVVVSKPALSQLESRIRGSKGSAS